MKTPKIIILLLIIIIAVLCESCLGTINNDWICIPGKRIGPITKETNGMALIKIFGKKNIKTITTESDELGLPGEIYTYVYPNSKNEIQIRWNEQKPWIVSIYKNGTQWRTLEGLTIGSSINELVKINKRNFVISGYGWEYGGYVTSWNNGELTKYKGKLDVFLDEGNGTLKGSNFIGEKLRISSDDQQLLQAKPKVKLMNIIF